MHVAVLGAGYGGLSVVRTLEQTLGADAQITLVDERDTHLVQHLIHRLIRYPSLEEELTIPLSELLDRATHRQARVTGLDADAGEVALADGRLSYDVGVLALGAQTAFHGLSGLEANATPLKRARHARRIRSDALDVCRSGGTVVVGGAGLSGIQAAGELAELAAEADGVEVRLLEQEDTVAPAFPTPFQRAVAEELTKRGVRVETGRTVEHADGETLSLSSGAEIDYDQFVWAGGIAGQDAVGERPAVRADLRLGERTFGVGDAARVIDENGEPAPASAQTAVRQADVAAANVAKLLRARNRADGFRPRLERYRYEELGWLVSVGDGAVAQIGPTILRGGAAKALKTTVGAGYLGSIGAVRNATQYVWEKVGDEHDERPHEEGETPDGRNRHND